MPVDTYYYAGTQTFVVPNQCTTIHILASGAATSSHDWAKRSRGGSAEGDLAVTPGETLYFVVGGVGAAPTTSPVGSTPGGYNGGGAGGKGPSGNGGGGSGASDVRQGGSGLLNRKIVGAGAGGYHVIDNGTNSASGGRGGPSVGEQGSGGTAGGSGLGGTQSAGGASGTNGHAGALGVGGSSGYLGSASFPYGPAGGGSGYYGGGSGFPASGQIGLSGGGGSNYIGGVTNGVSTQNAHDVGVAGQFPPGQNGSINAMYNVPPDKPTVDDLPTYFRVDQPMSLPFTYNDVDEHGGFFNGVPLGLPKDPMSRADVRWRPVSTTTWVELDNVAVAGGNPYTYTFLANFASSYAGVQLEFQVRTFDSYGAIGPWSNSVYSTPLDAATSSAVVIVAPPQINNQYPVLQLSLTSGAAFYGGRVTAWTDVAGAPGVQVCEIDYTQAASTMTTFTWNTSLDTPSHAVSNPGFEFTTGQKYHFLVALATAPNVYSDPSDSGAIIVAINLAQVASIVATPLPDNIPPAVRLDITNVADDDNPASYNNIYRIDISGGSPERIRIAHGVPVNGSFTDFLAGFSTLYEYDVESVYVSS